jgi:acyl carrier protein
VTRPTTNAQPWPDAFEKILREHCRFVAPEAPIDPDITLTVQGVDSFAMLVLLSGIEDGWDIAVPDEMLTVEVFSTPRVLWSAMAELIAQQNGTGGND